MEGIAYDRQSILHDSSQSGGGSELWPTLNGKKIYVYGDSLSDESTADPWVSGTTYYQYDRVYLSNTQYYKCKQKHTASSERKPPNSEYWEVADFTTRGLQPNWVYLMRQILNKSTIVNWSRAGWTIAGLANYPNASISDLVKNHPPAQDTDIIILYGGSNDFNASTEVGVNTRLTNPTEAQRCTFWGGLQVIGNNIRGAAPKAHVFVVTLPKKYRAVTKDGESWHPWPQNHDLTKPSVFYDTALAAWASINGYSLIDGYTFPSYIPAVKSIRQMFTTDGLHQSYTYAPILVDYILSKLASGGDSALAMNSTRLDIQSLSPDGDFSGTAWAFATFSSTGFITYAVAGKWTLAEGVTKDLFVFGDSADHMKANESGPFQGMITVAGQSAQPCILYNSNSKIQIMNPPVTGTATIAFAITRTTRYNGVNYEDDKAGDWNATP